MTQLTDTLMLAAGIGIGATMVMDLWLMLLKRLGRKTLNFAFIGRWAGHVLHGKVAHRAIAQAAPIQGELALGWLLHYLTGIAFAGLLLAVAGNDWALDPSLLPALMLGIVTVSVPLLVIQPCMGAGLASRNTPTPLRNCLMSVATHAVFGMGLYVSALAIAACNLH